MTDEPIKEILGTSKCPQCATMEKSTNNDCRVTTVPLVSECQLTAATGGAELSCYRCTIPFGVVILIAGVVVTAVAYSFNSHGSIISVLGLLLLSSGLLLLALSALCWKIRQRNKKAKRRESQTALVANQRSLFA
ncbi:transmembrane protein 100 [Rhineura floridana]|uniref:transmembrane protein 100 n=1 Tax=Rhineura floridana TaxID=261503 RepID=UPI002AC7FDB2|nr:transmembrane protein 100 [Rhineura floridana]XP_061471300.1 transmembrane protein 100 [Rhineura floridana]XP_061471301.1 transmembrane protein 100 [Rhineura floridana]XP_061471302.1 transmembrane protein 100 [Rhineura floridana]XP_061471303.1 transmembrane protein 100 [Rhineura floridana]XP_061471304.1 transmembrane protein 100 [Rhineura floridana]